MQLAKQIWMTWVLLHGLLFIYAQPFEIHGLVKDGHNEEPIPFASVEIRPSRTGMITDSLGFFHFTLQKINPEDSIYISYVGYKTYVVALSAFKDSSLMNIALQRGESNAVVKTKANWGLILWRKVVKHKDENTRRNYECFSYEMHNKLEIDLDRLNQEKVKAFKLLKPFNFVLENMDSSEGGPPVLPVFLTETLSDYYSKSSPHVTREVIKASKTNGINNESVTKLLGGTDQNVNIYDNYLPVFDKQFVSPLSDNGSAFYRYSVPDTVVLNGRRFFHWVFTAKHKGDNTFEGDAWVHDSTFAIQRIQLRLTNNSPVNFVENLSIYQDFRMVNDSIWVLSKEKFIADVFPAGKSKFGMKGRKTTTYRNTLINDPSTLAELAKNKLKEEVIVLPDSEMKTDTFWTAGRHEELNKNEKAIYHMIDTLQKMPLFKKYYNSLYFLTTGYKSIGNYEIGPWFNWISTNAWEGLRLRFDLGTTPGFHKNMYLHGYLAYGFGDQKFKGKAEGYYFFKKNPRTYIHLNYFNDLDNGQNYYDEVSLDNIFTLAIRKSNIPIKFMKIEMQQVEYFKSTAGGFSMKLEATHKIYNPLQNLPDEEYFKGGPGETFNNFETSITLRYGYLEKFLDGNYFRVSLGSQFPIPEIRYSKGWSGVMNSNYDYHKVYVRISDYVKLPPLGHLDYSIYAGKTFGTLPYMLLDVAPGNEIYYYNKYAFNLMNRYQYINDKYAGFSVEHNIGSGLFKYIPLTRRMKLRQFWNVKTLLGGLSQANKDLNFVPGHPFVSLDGKVYTEIGTGIDNVLKFLRFDVVWRLSPSPLPENWQERFGVFGSFRLAF